MEKIERKYAIITGFMGTVRDRFIEYHPKREMEQMVEMAARVPKCTGLEVVYPQNFEDAGALKILLDKYKLETAAVNLNIKGDEIWRYGTFSCPDKYVRDAAIQKMKNAMDAAAELGCNMVQTALLNDGTDYPFELNYLDAYKYLADGIRECAEYRPDVRISLEYKLSEPRVRCLFNNAGKMAYLCELIGKDNVGVTLDTGHAFQSLEAPGESAAFLGANKRLFYVHVNDNTRSWDWDLLPGVVNLWEFIEFFYYLKKVGYTGYFTADVFPNRNDPIKIFTKTFEWMDFMLDICEKLDEAKVEQLQREKDNFGLLDYVRSLL